MARPKEFDPERALERAMHVFWRQGYEATSVTDLTDALGISRASLYGTFGNKDAIYERALERYRLLEGTRTLSCLTADGTARDRIRALFERLAEGALADGENKGCLVLNAAMERPHDAATAAQVRSALAAIELALAGVLAEGQERGELPTGRDPRELARFLTTSLQGVRLMAKATRDRRVLEDTIAVVLRALD